MMKWEKMRKMGIFCLIFLILFGGGSFGHDVFAKPSPAKETYFKEMLQPYLSVIKKNYYKKIDEKKLLKETWKSVGDKTSDEKVIRTLIAGLKDPYSEFFAREQLEDFDSLMEGKFYGIGVKVKKEKSGEVLITEVFEESPAKEAGLKAKDRILKVAGKNVAGMELSEVILLIKGEEGSKVKITVKRGKKKKNFLVERREIIIPSVKAKYYKKQNVGYLKVSEFLANTDEEFDHLLDGLEEKGIEGLIVDLRNNGGGYVDTAHNMLDRMLPSEKLLYSFEYKGGKKVSYYSGHEEDSIDKWVDIPVVLLMNRYSASASEIFAGGLRDHEVAYIIGEKSFGKGVAQSIIRIRDAKVEGGIKLTTLNYLLPKGESINKIGIKPDKAIKNKKNKNGKEVDQQLKEAFKMLEKMN